MYGIQINYKDVWSTLEVDLIELYKSEELNEVDEILAIKLEALAQAYYSNSIDENIDPIFMRSSKILNVVQGNKYYFSNRTYSKELQDKVEKIMLVIAEFDRALKRELKTIRKTEDKIDTKRFDNIDQDKIERMYQNEY